MLEEIQTTGILMTVRVIPRRLADEGSRSSWRVATPRSLSRLGSLGMTFAVNGARPQFAPTSSTRPGQPRGAEGRRRLARALGVALGPDAADACPEAEHAPGDQARSP